MVVSTLFTYTKPCTVEKKRGALVVRLPSTFERTEFRQTPSENNFCGKDFENKYVSACTSRHFYNVNVCGRYRLEKKAPAVAVKKKQHVKIYLSSSMKIFTWKTAPAAAVTTNTKQRHN